MAIQTQQKIWRKNLQKYVEMKSIYKISENSQIILIAKEDKFTYHSAPIEAHFQIHNVKFVKKDKVTRFFLPSSEKGFSHYMFSLIHQKRHMGMWYMQDVFKPVGKILLS